MADLTLGIAKNIVKTGMAIKEALDTIRQNEEECEELQVLVATVIAILSRLEEVELMIHSAMCGALVSLNRSLDRALKLVTELQNRNGLHRFLTARDMAKQLRRVHDDIQQKMQVGNFAITASMMEVTIKLTKTTIVRYDGAHPLLTQPQDAMELEMYSSHSNTGLTKFSLSKTVTTHQVSEEATLRISLAAVRNATQAAQRIQMAFRAYDRFMERQAAVASGVDSIGLADEARDLIIVGGHGVDSIKLTSGLRRRAAAAERIQMAFRAYRFRERQAAVASGVDSIGLADEARDLIIVGGHGVDSIKLTSGLRRRVRPAQLVQLSEAEEDKKPNVDMSRAVEAQRIVRDEEEQHEQSRAGSSGLRAITAKFSRLIWRRPRKSTSRPAPLPLLTEHEHTDTPAWSSTTVSAASLPQSCTLHDQEHARASPLRTRAEDLSATPQPAAVLHPVRRRRRTFNMSRARRRASLPAAWPGASCQG